MLARIQDDRNASNYRQAEQRPPRKPNDWECFEGHWPTRRYFARSPLLSQRNDAGWSCVTIASCSLSTNRGILSIVVASAVQVWWDRQGEATFAFTILGLAAQREIGIRMALGAQRR
jgi:hypothetical protein